MSCWRRIGLLDLKRRTEWHARGVKSGFSQWMKKCRAVSDYKREKRFGPPVKPRTLSADVVLNYRFEACSFCRFVPSKRHPFTFVPFQSFCLFLSIFCMYSYIKTLNPLHVYEVPYIKIKTKTKTKKKKKTFSIYLQNYGLFKV